MHMAGYGKRRSCENQSVTVQTFTFSTNAMNTSFKTKHNVGQPDRLVRFVFGLFLLALALLSLTGFWSMAAFVLGLILVATGFFGICPIYRLMGINTCANR